MKLKNEFVTHISNGLQHIINTSGNFNGLITGNETSAFIVDMLKNDTTEDEIISAMLEKYDVALYYRPSDNKCVLHRILKVRENDYIFYGDNCWQTEIVPEDKIIGVAVSFRKSGKWIPVNDKKYMTYVHIWCDFLPARRIVFRVRDKIKRTIKNVKRQQSHA